MQYQQVKRGLTNQRSSKSQVKTSQRRIKKKSTNLHEPLNIQRKIICSCETGCPTCTPPIIQTKLKISHPSDEFEREADTISEEIINKTIYKSSKLSSKKKIYNSDNFLNPKISSLHPNCKKTPCVMPDLENKIFRFSTYLLWRDRYLLYFHARFPTSNSDI